MSIDQHKARTLGQSERLAQTGERIAGLVFGLDADTPGSRWESHAEEKGCQPSRGPWCSLNQRSWYCFMSRPIASIGHSHGAGGTSATSSLVPWLFKTAA
jgi:hypothetical protein